MVEVFLCSVWFVHIKTGSPLVTHTVSAQRCLHVSVKCLAQTQYNKDSLEFVITCTKFSVDGLHTFIRRGRSRIGHRMSRTGRPRWDVPSGTSCPV